MKKEYLILAALIIALFAYLIFHNGNKTNYTLPDIPTISGSKITKLNIDKGKTNIFLTKDNGKWFVSDKKYPADPEKIQPMLKVIKTLGLSTLVSRNDDLTRYGLDKGHRIEVVAKNKSQILRKIKIGKTAPTYRHTFVQVGNNQNVYYAIGNFRSDFDNDIDGFRDKKLLSFDGKTVRGITIEKGKKQKEFFLKKSRSKKKVVAYNKGNEAKNKMKEAVKPVKTKLTQMEKWESKDGSSFKPENIKSLISRLANFKCTHYTDNDSKNAYKAKEPLCTIIIQGKKQMSLSLYNKNKDGYYPGICSENRYPFLLDSYEGDNLMTKVNTLLGIKKVKKKKK